MHQFPDTTVLCNFAAVDEMSLLREYLGTHARWVQSIEAELKKSLGIHRPLEVIWRDDWFGDAVVLNRGDEPERVDRFRRLHMGGLRDRPTQHLGESETFIALTNREDLRESVFLSDDHDAYRVFSMLGVRVADTQDVLAGLVGRRSISSRDGVELAVRMEAAGRSLRRIPSRPVELER
jgi:predicted nucleic acid-binding protein